MHVVVLSIIVAIAVCALLLAGFGLFALTPRGRRIGEHERQDGPRLA